MWVYLVMSRDATGTSPHGTQYPRTTLGLAARLTGAGAAEATAMAVAAKARSEILMVGRGI